ncbi:TonB-dependent receptor [Gilvimarinus xylanilyticus]|uniref:TonB-dependent receptor n=1 Tax=Gilvimarinus xylanilyticus TaxID=2944139 RepID=A0A9X2KS39_9GAMM|nr:TonB-dependent receptor [Gilvimarinus xylanilyticus]MCP8898466.1 TonB-dependent receptor [Gilvimarinus xylanilyticus]
MKVFALKKSVICFSACLLSVNAMAADNTDTKSKTRNVEEIIVNGEKISRSLKETTSSVAVISEEELTSLQHVNLRDAISDVPNVVTKSGAVPDIRGVSGNGSAGGFNSISGGAKGRVSILVDGVAQPFVADFTGDSGMWEVEQVEVYRGPQSTSNGQNSIAGSIYIETKQPTQEWEGAARLGYRNEEQYIDSAVALSGPIVQDKLAFRVSFENLDAETITGEEGFDTNPPDYDLNEIKTQRGRAKLLWTPIDNLAATLTYASNNEKGDTGRVFYENTDNGEYNRIFFRNIETDVSTTSLDVDYQINESMSVDVLLAAMDYEWGFDSYEPDPAAEQQLVFDESNLNLDVRFNFGLNNERFNGFVGVAYFERDHDVVSSGAFPYFGDDSSDSEAVYGELTIGLSDRFRVIAGGRYQKESQLRNFTYAPIDSTLDTDESIFLPKLVLQYDITENTTIALGGREGYNGPGGALNFTAQEYSYFDKEEVTTYEFSSRSSFADNTVFLNANVFFNQYEGYQALSSSRFITNMDEVETYGVEVELLASVTESLQLSAGLGLLETEITDAGADYPDVNGNELDSAPGVTANIGAKYWLTDSFSIGATANYVGEYFGDFANTEERVAGDYTLLRLNANYEVGNWLITAFVNNATDEEALLSQEPVSGRYPYGYKSIVDPRNAGASVTYSF